MNASNGEPARSGWSLRRRLMVLATVSTLVAWIGGGAAVYLVAAEESSTMYDQHMADIARVILRFSEHEIDEIRAEKRENVHVETAVTLGARYRYQIFSADGVALLTSFNATGAPLAPLDQVGYVTREIDGEPMRTCAIWSGDRTKVVLVAEPLSQREHFVVNLHGYFGVLFAGSLPLLMLLNLKMLDRSTRALVESARQLINRSPRDLQPLVIDSPPLEMEPLLRSMNELFKRFNDALANEQRLTSAAAHELRSPLAAVKLQAQVAARARNPEEARRALDGLAHSIDRAARMVDQLLTLARLDSLSAAHAGFARLRLDRVAAAVIEDLAPLLDKSGLAVTKELQPAFADGAEFGVAVLLRNLIENAVRYTPAGGAVRISTRTDQGRAQAIVEDSGPGIPPADRERVFARFVRLPSGNADGCGIGLSIVRSVARVHGAQVSLDDSEFGGLRVTVTFPAGAVPSIGTDEVGNLPTRAGGELRTP